jgi:hypothetical protein
MKPEIQLGAWIVAAHKALSRWPSDHVALDPYESIINAGCAADLFSATRAMGAVNKDKFEAHRKLAKLKGSIAKNLLKEAQSLGFAQITWSDKNSINSFEFNDNSKKGVLEAVGKLFSVLDPTDVAKATLDVLAATVVLPQRESDCRSLLSGKGYSDKDIDLTIRLSCDLGLVSKTVETESGEVLLFNPHAFEKDAQDVHATIKKLSPSQQQKALEIVEFVKAHPGVPLKNHMDMEILSVLVKAGIVNQSRITTRTNVRGVYFPTAPYAWGLFDKSAGVALSQDLIDDAKLLLNSFRYGQYYSSAGRGKIIDPGWIVGALVTNGAIGVAKPASAIGEDYPLALSRGIVSIVESRRYPGRYSMELLKFDVGEAVKEVLEQKTLLPTEKIPSPEQLERAGQFVSPTTVRLETELPEAMKQYHEELIFGLRTIRKRS